MIEIIYGRFFSGTKSIGSVDPTFMRKINRVFLCFVASTIHHGLKAWSDGVLNLKAPEYNYLNSNRTSPLFRRVPSVF